MCAPSVYYPSGLGQIDASAIASIVGAAASLASAGAGIVASKMAAKAQAKAAKKSNAQMIAETKRQEQAQLQIAAAQSGSSSVPAAAGSVNWIPFAAVGGIVLLGFFFLSGRR